MTRRTATAITVKAPPGAVSGPLHVATRDGRTTTAQRFVAVSGTGAGQVESSQTTSTADTTAPTVAVTTPGNWAEVHFEAEAGEDLDFGFSGSTFNRPVTVRLLSPTGVQVGSGTSYSGAAGEREVQDAPLAGSYVLLLEPGSTNIGAVTVTLLNPAGAAQPARSSPTAVTPCWRSTDG
ncbi:hypothetical protein [Streptomyces sp. NPDC060198]|uniref:hypothetical protein n=1 Tax=Streptomyces sp. NPDC060198 TaxID=3347070 RepID=UPI00365034AB